MKRSILRLGDFMETEVSWWFYYFHLYKSNCKYRYISIRGGFVGGMSPSLETGGTLPHGKIRSKRRKRSLFQESKSHFPPSTVVITTLYSVQYAKHHILSINSPISVDLIFCFQWFNFGLELFAEFCLDLIFLFYFV